MTITYKKLACLLAVLLLFSGCSVQSGLSDTAESSSNTGLWRPVDEPLPPPQITPSATDSDAEKESGPEKDAPAEDLSWMEKACPPCSFTEDPAGCISYVVWEHLQASIGRWRHITVQECLDKPRCFQEMALMDFDQDGIPEMLWTDVLLSQYNPIEVYDLSGDTPTQMFFIGGSLTGADFLQSKTGNVVAHLSSWHVSGYYYYEHEWYVQKLSDGNWDFWRCDQSYKYEEPDSKYVQHFYEDVDDPDDVLYNQRTGLSAASVTDDRYVSMDYFEFIHQSDYTETGEDWWISLGKMLWQKYEEAGQEGIE